MKKTLITVIAAAAMLMGLASCSMLTKDALKNDGKSWKNKRNTLNTADPDCGKVTLKNTADYKVTGTYFMWTNENGIVRDDLPTTPKKDGNGDYYFQITPAMIQKEDLNGNERSEVFVLYTVISGKDKDHEDLTKWDVRGRFAVYTDASVDVYVEKYPEVIAPVGVVSITNDEPVNSSVYKNGDYTITEIWPLDPKADKEGSTAENDKIGGKYVVSETMVFKKLTVKKGETIKVPVKAGKQIIGLYQPNRDTAPKGSELEYGGPSAADIKNTKHYDTDGDGVKDKTRAELYGFADKIADLVETDAKDAKKIEKYYADANIATIFANEIKVAAHGTVNAGNSSGFGAYFFNHKDGIRTREAGDEVYDVEVIEGTMEK